MSGLFITIEGPDGAGKTSVLEELYPRLQLEAKRDIVKTREPGGVKIAEKIRRIILDPKNSEMDERTEALLYAAARRQHLIQVILPALNEGKLIKGQGAGSVFLRLHVSMNLPPKARSLTSLCIWMSIRIQV